MNPIELRSDTFTLPTEEMRRAMADAQVGDDVFGEDPTINRLEELAAEMLGKEAGLFVASGTMGNIVSVLAQTRRGDEIIVGDQSHIFYYEQGGCAALGGLQVRTLKNLSDGTLDLVEIKDAIRADNIHFPRTGLIALENTHNRCGGFPLSAEYIKQVSEIAKKHKIKLHIDGARLFNAAIALNVEPKQLAKHADSITICLSKGLAAPVGSVVCGTKDFIFEARRVRKQLGGGMRQAGVIAAAGIIALEKMTKRLEKDHANAKKLAAGLADIKGIIIDPDMIHTNIVYFDVDPKIIKTEKLVDELKKNGALIMALGENRCRAVTNYHVTSEDIEKAVSVFQSIIK